LRDQARLGELAVQVIDDGHGLAKLKAVVIDQRHAGARILGDVRGFLLLHDAYVHRQQVMVNALQAHNDPHAIGRGAIEKAVKIHAYTTATVMLPKPSTEPTMVWPATTGPTPSGVPV